MDILRWLGGMLVWCVIWGVPVIFCGIVLREVFWFFWDKKFFKQRAHLQFGLAFMLLATATVAVICSLVRFFVGANHNWGVIDFLWLALAVVFILWVLYMGRVFITDLLENFGLIEPRVDIHRFLRKRPDTDSDDQFVAPEGIDDEPPTGESKKRKRPRRRWWTARRWRTRVQEIRRLFPYRRPIGRDEF